MWRKMTEDDLTASLTANEINTFRKSGAWKADPIELLLSRTAAMIRAYIRTNGKTRMSPDPLEVPESCIAPAMNYVAYDLAMRLGGEATDSRTAARKDAVTFFQNLSRRYVTVEGYDDDEDKVTAGPSAQVVHAQPSKFENMRGL